MRKINFVAIMLFCGVTVFAQAVKDRNVIPVAVNLNQVLRMTITNGGNIEFVFNTIDDYKKGLSAESASTAQNPAASQAMYKTDFTVSSSTRWTLSYGAEEPTFLGTDNAAAKFDLTNVGYTITNNGANHFETGAKGATPTASLFSAPTKNATEVAALEVYPQVLIEDNGTAKANAGDAKDNSFTLNWRCGTAEAGAVKPMNPIKLIDQSPSPAPDRYVVNVLFDLAIN
ncbi:MAG: hypothetical protein Q8904_09805 [Bacteroidota bacterium]|nr:hypothetical protein [Bacteroidota bacterium]